MPRSRTTARPRPKSRPDRPTVDEVEAAEEEVLRAVVRWVKADDEGSRVGALDRLLPLVGPARPWLPIDGDAALASDTDGDAASDGCLWGGFQ